MNRNVRKNCVEIDFISQTYISMSIKQSFKRGEFYRYIYHPKYRIYRYNN